MTKLSCGVRIDTNGTATPWRDNSVSQPAPRLGITGQVLHALVPRVAQIIMNTTFRMFPDSSAAKKKEAGLLPEIPSADQVAFQQFMRGIYF